MQSDIKKSLPALRALHISIPVLDMDAALEFYSEVLGLRVLERSEEISQLYLGNDRLSLRKTSTDSSSLQLDSLKGMCSRHFGFRVDRYEDIDLIETELRNRGIPIVLSAFDRPDGRSVFCVDPSGNQIELYYEIP